MIVPPKLRLKNTIKFPTSVIVGGLNSLGLEIADSLMKQGGYVVIIDAVTKQNIERFDKFPDNAMISFLDYASIPHLEEDIRRLDYVFYFGHHSIDFRNEVSTQEFLTFSNYLDATLALAVKFDARFLLTTSIKAHQILFSDNGGFDIAIKSSPVHTYSDMEVQRYAEGLVMEYNNKVKLNTRILRLGEIIGDGMDFGHQSAFIDLIMNAVQGEYLMLKHDGLEHEWFIHLLDAAYALIKAQFSKETNSKVFSVCYENTYTHLSIAYKIQELDETVKEIRFEQMTNSLPPLKIHKPAPNLSEIGWMARVSFDKAIKQSLGLAKIFITESSFSQAALNQSNSSKLGNIVEYKKQEQEIRKRRIFKADNELKLQQKKREVTLKQRLVNLFWIVFTKMAGIFTFLKKRSPAELAFMTFLLVLLSAIYFLIVSPLLVLTRTYLELVPAVESMSQSIQQKDFEKLYSISQSSQTQLETLSQILINYKGVADFFSAEVSYSAIQRIVDAYRILSDGISDFAYALEPVNKIARAYNNNTQLRTSSESYLSVISSENNISELLEQLSQRTAFVESGINKYEQGINLLNQINTDSLPQALKEPVMQISNKLNSLNNYTQIVSTFANLPELLGHNKTTNYLLVLLDNSIPTPAGGRISAYGLFSIRDGNIESSRVQSVEDVAFDLTNLTDETIKLINQRRFITANKSNISLESLSSLADKDMFAETVSEVWQKTFNISLDGVITLNLDFIQSAFDQIPQIVQPELAGVDFTAGNILSNLNLALASTKTITQKKSILAQLEAFLIYNLLSTVQNNFSGVVNLLTNSYDTGDLNSVLFKIKNTDEKNFKELSDYYVQPSILLSDNRIVGVDQFPEAVVDMNISFRSDGSSVNTVTFNFPQTGAVQEVSICLNPDVRESNIDVSQNTISSRSIVVNDSTGDICVVAQAISERTFVVEWLEESKINLTNSPVSQFLGIAKIPGVVTNLDLEIEVATGLKLTSKDSRFKQNNSKLIFSEKISKDEIFEIQLSN